MKKRLLIAFLLFKMATVFAQPSEAEYSALFDLYNGTNGQNWTNQTGWSTADPEVVQSVVGWHGVVTDQAGHVIELRLNNNMLQGIIPQSFIDLESLQILDLSNNNLRDEVPWTILYIQSLTFLDLSSNHLNGAFPSDLSGAPSLLTVYLNDNYFVFSDLLEFGQNFSGTLVYGDQALVDFERTFLTEIGGSLNLISNVDRTTSPQSKYQWFKVVNGTTTPVNLSPTTTGHTISITGISQSDIGISYFYKIYNDAAPDLVLTSQLQTIGLASAGINCASTLTQEFNALMDLYNATNGAEWKENTGWRDADPNVPQTVHGWYGIKTDANGHVTDIDLDGVADFTIITDAQGYQVYTGNNLYGTIPPTIGNLSCLRVLNVGGNRLIGAIPEEIGLLTNLVWLVGSTNQFSGSLPSSIGNLTKLDRILMEHNHLTGNIPPSIGNLVDLWALLLNDNNLTGPIPSTLGNLKKLRFFYLYNNQLTGSIPEELGAMTAAYRIGFQNNQLTGTIPSSLANLSNLQLLYLSHNRLQGIVPPALSSITPLMTVAFDNNKFTFSSFLELKNSFSGTTFSYEPQDIIDIERTLEGEISEPLVLTTQVDRNTTPPSLYQWFKTLNGTSEPLNSASVGGHTHTIAALAETDANTDYFYTISNLSAPGLVLTSRLQHLTLSPAQDSPDVNYIRTIDVTVEGKTGVADVESFSANERIINYTYFDGLGRPMQQVAQQASPLKRDIVTPLMYDEFGREVRKYLPFSSGSNGGYKINAEIIDAIGNYIGIAQPFYASESDAVADDSRPYSEIIFEPSPLNRPDKEYGPGQAWAPSPGNDKFVKYTYLTNVHNSSGSLEQEAIIAWKVSEEGIAVKENAVANFIEPGGFYSSHQLYVKATLDEHGNAVREYTNKQGQVILKKVQVVANSTNLNSLEDWACTYYIYDDMSNLRFVLPPEGVKQYLEQTAQN